MCGIIGYATSKPRAGLKDFLGQGLIVDSLRGMCGTGIYAYDTKEGESLVWKRALAGPDFVNTRQFDQYAGKASWLNLAIGHNRASTIGSAKDVNCHPFVYDHIGLVHNGTLRNYTSLVKSYQEFSHSVDSAYAAYAMAKYGVKDTLEKIEGAFVFVWHNMQDNTINIARNGMRDIWYITDKEGENLYFASEYQMLAWLLDRHNMNTWGKYKSPAEFTILSWQLGKPFKQPMITPFEEYKPPKYESSSWHGRGGRSFNKDEQDLMDLGIDQYEILPLSKLAFTKYHEAGTKGRIDGFCLVGQKEYRFRCHGIEEAEAPQILNAKATSSPAVSVWFDDKIPCVVGRRIIIDEDASEEGGAEGALPELFRGPRNKIIEKDEFVKLIADGCCYCGSPIVLDEAEQVEWLHMSDKDQPICGACSSDPQTAFELRWYRTGHKYGESN